MVNENVSDNLPDESIDFCTDDELKGFVSQFEGEDISYRVTLYKFADKNQGARKAVVYQWVDEYPSVHDIGLEFGGGRYVAFVTFPDKKIHGTNKPVMKSFSFRLHDSYDDLKARQNKVPSIVESQSRNPMIDAMQMLESLVKIVQPLIASRNNNPVEQVMSGITPLIIESAKQNQSIMSEMMKGQYQMLNEIQKQRFEEIVEDQGSEEEPGSILDQILPLVEQFAPMLLGDKTGLMVKQASGMIKKSAQFKQLLSDKDAYLRLLDHLDEKYGSDKTTKILKQLGLKRS